jgi:hypothetical protein
MCVGEREGGRGEVYVGLRSGRERGTWRHTMRQGLFQLCRLMTEGGHTLLPILML